MPNYPLTDTHCHLYFDSYDPDREEVIRKAEETGLVRMMVPGIDLESSAQAIVLSGQHESIYAAAGIHPNTEMIWTDHVGEQIHEMGQQPKVRAIGEIGLDYYRDYVSRENQAITFKKQLAIASALHLPVILHCRDAEDDLLAVLADWISSSKITWPVGVLHSFAGNQEHLKIGLDLGFFIGINGIVTFKNADSLRPVVQNIPPERLLIETDAPFLAPQALRGKRNQPAYVKYVLEKCAELLNIKADVLGTITTNNAKELFAW